jgi:transposase
MLGSDFNRLTGSPCWPPRLLLSVWLYAYQQGIASAREVERGMQWEPGLRWLCGLEVVNVPTLCDFRMAQKEKLEALMAQLLTVLSGEGLVDISTVIQDGTKKCSAKNEHTAKRRKFGSVKRNRKRGACGTPNTAAGCTAITCSSRQKPATTSSWASV